MVLHPDAQMRETVDRARRLIEESGGQVQQVHEWGMRELAYPVRKLSRGYYVLAEYTATSDVVQELERTLRITDAILRFISVASSTVRRKEKPSKVRRAARIASQGRAGADAPQSVD